MVKMRDTCSSSSNVSVINVATPALSAQKETSLPKNVPNIAPILDRFLGFRFFQCEKEKNTELYGQKLTSSKGINDLAKVFLVRIKRGFYWFKVHNTDQIEWTLYIHVPQMVWYHILRVFHSSPTDAIHTISIINDAISIIFFVELR